ncbi:glycosyltransferase family protein [Mucilaginibacter psychrotolerans]|uniref:glycosyltransferase n=1 Tax=Mucilaginibacter psychrotolerans TaxID=1524096 RepID=UPI0013054314|nr:glycosyltransferase [Mucilaginibacter psychrotolerans]
MKSAKPLICIVTQSHLCRNPRVLKEAVTLAQNGYDVHILTSIYSGELLEQDKLSIAGIGITLHIIADNSRKDISSLWRRATNKAAKLLVRAGLMQIPQALGYGYRQYIKKSKALGAALYICHQEMATCIGAVLIKQGYNVAFDLEDWYSEDLLPEARQERPLGLLKRVEKLALEKGAYVVTTSHALADALQKAYGGQKPQVIYNVFPTPNLPIAEKAFNVPLKLFWFSQTIGPGRGLEGFIELIAGFKTGLELHLLGTVSAAYQEQLRTLLAPQHQILFHPLVPENDLMAKIAGYDVGLALEDTQPPSRNFTITNKFFQYIQAGLPVIATETAGQCEAFGEFGPGIMLRQNDTAGNSAALEAWLSNPSAVAAAAQKAGEAALQYNWDTESIKLLKLVADAIK